MQELSPSPPRSSRSSHSDFVKDQHIYSFKFIVVGDSCVGKSCLLQRFCRNRFDTEHSVTLGVQFACKVVHVDQNVPVKLQIWDTAGQEKFRSIARSYYRNAICCILVYDVTSKVSFENCARWIQDAREHAQPKICIVLVGNKADLDQKRQVSYKQGE